MDEFKGLGQEQLKQLEEKLHFLIDVEVEPDIDELTIEQLEEYLLDLDYRISDLDGYEPDDEDSDAHEEWEDKYYDLEELYKRVEERLEQLRR